MTVETVPSKEVTTKPPNGMSPAEHRHLGALEKRIAAGLQVFREVGNALLEIRDQRLYRNTHSSFEAYCRERWSMERQRAYYIMDAAKVDKVLGSPKDLMNEAQARELAPLLDEPDKAKKVWAAVEQRAKETQKPVTATLIKQVRQEILPPENGTGELSATDRLLQDITRLGNTFARWRQSKPNIGERQKVSKAIKSFIESVT